MLQRALCVSKPPGSGSAQTGELSQKKIKTIPGWAWAVVIGSP
ncbi:hypothetical protein BX257_4316 [Streptomyces sp. 3212.3]|nr:hypothetical protein BX257_4316 [Streptomyces sp. 3212.3]